MAPAALVQTHADSVSYNPSSPTERCNIYTWGKTPTKITACYRADQDIVAQYHSSVFQSSIQPLQPHETTTTPHQPAS